MNRRQRRAQSKSGSPAPLQIASNPQAILDEAIRHHRAGQLAEAEALYRRLLAIDSRHADALHLLGVIAHQVGRNDAAVELIGQAIAINGTAAVCHSNLGNALSELGRMEEALAAHETAIRIKPDFADAYYNRGNALTKLGRLEDALASYEQALTVRPDYPDAQFNRGNTLALLGRLSESVVAYETAVRLKPDYADAHSNLGNVLSKLGRIEDAVTAYEAAIRIKPGFAEAHFNLAFSLYGLGRIEDALVAYEAAIRDKPDYPEAHSNLGNLLRELGRLDDALVAYNSAIRTKPDYADAYSNLGNALYELGRFDEALAAYDTALRLNPGYADAHSNRGNVLREAGRLGEAIAAYNTALGIKADFADAQSNLGNALKEMGRLDAALAAYERALTLKPDFVVAHSNLLMCLGYHPRLSNETIFAEYLRFDAQHARALYPVRLEHGNDRSPDRRLRIGYVSPDFRSHSVAWFLEPVLRAHDRKAVELFCYAEVARPDSVTERFRSLADHWRNTVGLSDQQLAAQIRADEIDILVDLAGHTAKNRLMAFARKPAPVQVSWLGYPSTTGLSAMDYRLVDAVTDPPGEADRLASETLVRLDGCFLCYGPPSDAPEPAPPPSLAGAPVTFGSFNNPAKLSDATLDAWAALLLRLPEARLLLKGRPFGDGATRAFYLARLAERGLAADRVELVGWLPEGAHHLALYDRVDIALDPFPYNGTTTTCEALWMGVPVVSLRGDRHAGRVGAALLGQMGLDELIAETARDYVTIAARLAETPQRLADLRARLRPLMASSAVCAAPTFADRLENIYRTLWRRWCER